MRVLITNAYHHAHTHTHLMCEALSFMYVVQSISALRCSVSFLVCPTPCRSLGHCEIRKGVHTWRAEGNCAAGAPSQRSMASSRTHLFLRLSPRQQVVLRCCWRRFASASAPFDWWHCSTESIQSRGLPLFLGAGSVKQCMHSVRSLLGVHLLDSC